jgi:hypothetical protein
MFKTIPAYAMFETVDIITSSKTILPIFFGHQYFPPIKDITKIKTKLLAVWLPCICCLFGSIRFWAKEMVAPNLQGKRLILL